MTCISNWKRVNINGNGPVIRNIPNEGTTSWRNEAFIRYQSRKNLAFEGGISHTKRDLDEIVYIMGCFGGKDSKIEELSISYTALNIGLQYKINPPLWMKCPLLEKLRNYIGVSFSPILANTLTKHTYTSYDIAASMQQQAIENNTRYITLSAGLNHTLVYQLNKHFNLLSRVGADYIFSGRYNTVANAKGSANLGISYNIR
jgi:hypothetical protein